MLRRACVIKHVIKKEREDEEEDINSYWMTLSKRDNVVN
jgi:hypothetical protein